MEIWRVGECDWGSMREQIAGRRITPNLPNFLSILYASEPTP
jgi:hypothetical protein